MAKGESLQTSNNNLLRTNVCYKAFLVRQTLQFCESLSAFSSPHVKIFNSPLASRISSFWNQDENIKSSDFRNKPGVKYFIQLRTFFTFKYFLHLKEVLKA